MRAKQQAEKESERVWNEVGYYSLYTLALENLWFGTSIESVLTASFEDLVFFTTINNVTK